MILILHPDYSDYTCTMLGMLFIKVMEVNVHETLCKIWISFACVEDTMTTLGLVRQCFLLYGSLILLWSSFASITLIFTNTVILPEQCGGRETSPRARNQCCCYFLS